MQEVCLFVFVCLILYVPTTIFQLNRDDLPGLFVCFVSSCRKSTAMVMAGRLPGLTSTKLG